MKSMYTIHFNRQNLMQPISIYFSDFFFLIEPYVVIFLMVCDALYVTIVNIESKNVYVIRIFRLIPTVALRGLPEFFSRLNDILITDSSPSTH